jgi:glycosyltransferase involved in cell wall biosynthesis
LDSDLPPHIEFEILISDNASTDRTHEILKDLAAHNPSIKVFEQVKNVGARNNWLFLLSQSDADWIFFIDAHDKIEEGYIRELVSQLLECKLAMIGSEIENWILGKDFEYRNHAGRYKFSDNRNIRAIQAAFYLSHNTICHALIPRKTLNPILTVSTKVLSFDLLVTYLYLSQINLRYIEKKYIRRYVPNSDGKYSAFNSAGVMESRSERVSGTILENLDNQFIPSEYRNLMRGVLPKALVLFCACILKLKHSNSDYQFKLFQACRYIFGKLTPWKAWVRTSI